MGSELLMAWTKQENYEFKGEASLLGEEEVIEMVLNKKVYLFTKLLLKDYWSNKITEWNQKYHSILTTEVTVLCEGKIVIQEMKYDSGHTPDGMTVQTVANQICGSTGQTIVKKIERDSVFNIPVLEILTPPSVMEIIETHFLFITGKFLLLEKELNNKAQSLTDIVFPS